MSLREKLSQEEWEAWEERLSNTPLRYGRYTKISNDDNTGEKHSKHKLSMSKLFKQFPRALQAVMLTSTYGHNKYKKTDKDWMNFSRVYGGSEIYKDACIRHQLDKEIYGEKDESGLPHIFHETWNKLAECELWIKENNIDIKEYI